MKQALALLTILLFLTPMNSPAQNPSPETAAPAYQHLVLFKFKDDAKKEDIQKVIDAFAALPDKIDTITSFKWGTNISPENKNQGFTHCFSVTFADQAGLETYLPHPAHKAFGETAGPVVDKVLVFDFIPEN